MACGNCGTGADGKPAGCKSNGYCSSSGCNKLGVFDWLTGVPLPGGQQPFDGVEVRFKNTRKGFYRNSAGLQLMPGDLVTVDAAPGHDVGMVSLTGELVKAQMQRKNLQGDTYELRKVLRKSTQEDIDRWHAARKLEDIFIETVHAIERIIPDCIGSIQLIQDGKSDTEIKDYLVARYGDFVLYRPPVKPTTWLLWFGPFALLAGAVAGLIAYLRRRASRVQPAHLSAADKASAEALLADTPPRPKDPA